MSAGSAEGFSSLLPAARKSTAFVSLPSMVVAPSVGMKSTLVEVKGCASLLTMAPVKGAVERSVLAATFTR